MEGEKRPSPQRFPTPGKYPWLIYYHGKRGNDITFCTISSSGPVKSEQKRIPELNDKRVVSCSDGWLLLTDDETRRLYSIWDPQTSECFDLPRQKSNFLIADSLLSSPPADPSCLVLLFASEVPIILYCRPGDQVWTEFNYGGSLKAQITGKDTQGRFLSHPVSCSGKIYAACTGAFFLVLVNLDEFNTICSISLLSQQVPDCYHLHSNRAKRFLVGSKDELFSVQLCYDITTFAELFRDTLTIEAHKFNFSANLWERVTSLHGRALFLGRDYNLSFPVVCDSGTEEAGSYIYFTNFDDETLYSYKVEDESITPYLPCSDLPKPWVLLPTWIMPVQREEECVDQPHIIIKEEAKNSREVEEPGKKEINIESIEEKGNLCDLPSDILMTMISAKLSFVDYMNIRCVNRICASTIRMKSNSFSRPCLIYSRRAKGVYDIVDSKIHGKHTLKIPEAVKDYTIGYAKDGWLLMRKDCAITFFNPFTNEIIKLPDKPRDCIATSSLIFTSMPSSSDCLVIAILGYGMEVCFHYFRSGDEEWSQVEFQPDDTKFEPSCSGPVFHEGSFYYQSKDGRLGVLQVLEAEAEFDDDEEEEEKVLQVLEAEANDTNDDDDDDDDDEEEEEEEEDENYHDDAIEWRVLDKLKSPYKNFRNNYLVECDESLVSVFEGRRGKRVWIRVFKLTDDNQDWQEVKSLGKYSVYLSRYSSIAYAEESPDMSNRIYFPRFYQGGLVYYSLNTKKYHSVGSVDLLENFFGTTMYNDCAWVEPRWYQS